MSGPLFTEFLPDAAGARKLGNCTLPDGWSARDEFDFVTTIVSSRGQVVLPRLAQSRMGLVTDTKFDWEITSESILLKPSISKPSAPVSVKDKISGLRVAKANGAKLATLDAGIPGVLRIG